MRRTHAIDKIATHPLQKLTAKTTSEDGYVCAQDTFLRMEEAVFSTKFLCLFPKTHPPIGFGRSTTLALSACSLNAGAQP